MKIIATRPWTFAEAAEYAFNELRTYIQRVSPSPIRRGSKPGIGRVRNANLKLRRTPLGCYQGHLFICGADVLGTADNLLGYEKEEEALSDFRYLRGMLAQKLPVHLDSTEGSKQIRQTTFKVIEGQILCIVCLIVDSSEDPKKLRHQLSASARFFDLGDRRQVDYIKRTQIRWIPEGHVLPKSDTGPQRTPQLAPGDDDNFDWD